MAPARYNSLLLGQAPRIPWSPRQHTMHGAGQHVLGDGLQAISWGQIARMQVTHIPMRLLRSLNAGGLQLGDGGMTLSTGDVRQCRVTVSEDLLILEGRLEARVICVEDVGWYTQGQVVGQNEDVGSGGTDPAPQLHHLITITAALYHLPTTPQTTATGGGYGCDDRVVGWAQAPAPKRSMNNDCRVSRDPQTS
ncbi:hypothetical protein BD779DRAFT_1476815 [Infundibulicybe gibba]|nr:hypothetical protein BD779DRAFT_1476815 [Infundibulicybe gibba]